MDDENLAQEGYFNAFSAVINDLDPKAVDFDFQLSTLCNALQISGLLTDDEQMRLNSMLHIVSVQSHPARNPSK